MDLAEWVQDKLTPDTVLAKFNEIAKYAKLNNYLTKQYQQKKIKEGKAIKVYNKTG